MPVVEHKCKGLVYRARVNLFYSSYGSIEVRKSLRLLKSKSCEGCEKCSWQEEFIKEDIACLGNHDWLSNIEDGKLYSYHIVASNDYESGMWEIYDSYFIEVQEE